MAGLVPGDTLSQADLLTNTGDQDLASVTLTTTATRSSSLDTDPVAGIQVQIQSCPVAWTQVGSAPRVGYTCASPTTVLASRPAIGTTMALSPLAALTAGRSDNLLVRDTLPESAGNDAQGQSSVIGYAFTGTQRVPGAR